ncbi:hypothetical protein ABE854_02945 [Enterococcus faecium]|uniref:hypothetical protein n=1 Tax=Enterococcus faecium TaxID=1352 RepID=UPI003D6B8D80
MLEYSGFFIKAVTLKKDIIIVLFFLLLLIGRFILIHYSPLPIIKEKRTLEYQGFFLSLITMINDGFL